MNTDPITIDIVSKPGHEPYRARMRGTKTIATCTMSAEFAASAVALKHWRGQKVQVKHIRGKEWQATVEPGEQYHVGDRISYQTDMMADPGESVVTEIMATGLRLDGKAGAVFARWHEIMGVVTRTDEATGALPQGAPTGAVPAPAPGDVSTADAPGVEPAAPAVAIGAAPMAAAEPCNVGSGEQDRSPAGDEGQSPTLASPAPALAIMLRRDLALTQLPGTLEECAAAIRNYLGQERLGGLRAAVLIAHMRRLIWPEPRQCGDWIAWAKEHVGLERRACFRYRNVGEFLLSPEVANLTMLHQISLVSCTVPKVEILAGLSGQALPVFLDKHDPAGMTAEEVKDLVDRYLLTTEQQKQLEVEREHKEKGALANAAREAVKRFASIPEERLAEVAKRAGPSACAIQGMRLVAAGIAAMDVKDADPTMVADWLETLKECQAALQQLSA